MPKEHLTGNPWAATESAMARPSAVTTVASAPTAPGLRAGIFVATSIVAAAEVVTFG